MYGHNPPAETIILLINSTLSKYLPLSIYSSGFATDLVNSDPEIVGQKNRRKKIFDNWCYLKNSMTVRPKSLLHKMIFPPSHTITLRMPLELFSFLNQVVILMFMRIISEPPQQILARCHYHMILSMKFAKRDFKHL